MSNIKSLAASFVKNLVLSRPFHNSAPSSRQRGIALLKYMRKRQFPFHKVRYYDEVERTEEIAKYPEEIPKYPPGEWGSMDTELAWSRFRMGEYLLKYPIFFERLREMYHCKKNMWYHSLNCPLDIPGTIEFYQYITRTVISSGKPESINDSENRANIEDLSNQLKVLLSAHSKDLPVARNTFTVDLMDCIYRWIAPQHDHLKDVHIDEGGNLETFVERYGYGDLEKCDGIDATIVDEDGFVKYRIRSRTTWQMRSRNPLAPFFSQDAIPTTEDGIPRYNYDPAIFDLNPVDCHGITNMPQHRTWHSNEFLVNKAGYWTDSPFWKGDPCEFGTLGVIEMPTPGFVKDLSNIEQEALKDIINSYYRAEGMMAGFAWTCAMAYNQGFTIYHDITYPISVQLVVTDGRKFMFLVYQLNSMTALSKAPDSGLPANLVWASEPMTLFDSVNENGDISNWNDEVVHRLISRMSHKPEAVEDSAVLRPHLDGEAPRDKVRFFNMIGEKPDPYEGYGRMKTMGRPHPNNIFFLKMVKRREIMEDIRKTWPGIGVLPGHYEARAEKRRKLMRFRKTRREKTEKGPTEWR